MEPVQMAKLIDPKKADNPVDKANSHEELFCSDTTKSTNSSCTYTRIAPPKNVIMDFLFSKVKAFKKFEDMSSFITSIMKASTYPFFVVDTDMNIQYMNPACLDFTGDNFKEIAGKVSCSDIFESDICKTECAILKAMTTKKPVVGKRVKVKDKNNKEHQIIVNAGPLIDNKGTILGGFEIWRDAMPDKEISSRVDTLLNTLDIFCREMTGMITSLSKEVNSKESAEILKNMREITKTLSDSGNNIFKSTCWDILSCPPERQVLCPAFPNNGNACWDIDYTWCDGQMQGLAAQKTKKCESCLVHKNLKQNTDKTKLTKRKKQL
ncbi:MAG: PAS domain-containing protein [Candidatus Omnitrophica bacterium]|nr:PAS domain-containing protein [Candidatus Omnitrophota bacterium]